MKPDTRNMITAVVLSLVVVVGWQYFIVGPQVERANQQLEIAAQQEANRGGADLATPSDSGLAGSGLATPIGTGEAPATSSSTPDGFATVREALANTPRVDIDTPSLIGSINLIGGRIDDLSLKNYRETVEPDSSIISLFSPVGAPGSYFSEQGWVVDPGGSAKGPDGETVWSVEGNQTLNEETPVTLTYDNGEGFIFSRTISVDDGFLFTITQSVKNNSNGDVALYPYSRIARHETPNVSGFFILHEGPIGVLGDANLIERSYQDLREER
ncbi:MAG: membrane protein insertase YidC, partial [Devosiaceae bacterium]|nr:membrane protein insertase YidC [Devosiaceae bacterium]